ncbi:MAG: efflux RND transporter permease subunit [Halofilum sp. (in: g-proteobacteria)]
MSAAGGGQREPGEGRALPGGGADDNGRRPRGPIQIFLDHRLAANLLIALMVLTGAYALSQLNTQFFPNFELDVIAVEVPWPGASAEDVEQAIIDPLEQDLRNVDQLRNMTSTSTLGTGVVTLEFESGTDMTEALEQVNDRVNQQRNLPENAETPITTRVIRYEPVARVLITGPEDPQQLRALARQFERELLDAGIARIEFTGLTEDEMAIEVPSANLYRLDMTLAEIGERVNAMARDLPAGAVGRDDTARQIRSLEQARDVTAFERLVIRGDEESGRTTLGDIASIDLRPQDGEVRARANGQRAIEMKLLRTETSDSLASARILDDWLAQARRDLPPGVELEVTDAFWELIAERIQLLLENGASGLLLVLGILFLFLNRHIALRVALGIPIAFTAAFVVLWAIGGSINMISLFGFIMSLGIIVDNAIVVSEHAYSLHQSGLSARRAAHDGARRMVGPVVAASLTTLAAFLPLMLIGGIIGNVLFDIPLVVICVIVATLVIAFLILPAQLKGVMNELRPPRDGSLRQRFDRGFDALRNGPFRRLVTRAIEHSAITLALAIGTLVVALGLAASGRIGFTFFPSPEGTIINAGVHFVAGTPPERVEDFLIEAEAALDETEEALGGDLVRAAVTRLGRGVDPGEGNAPRGDQFGNMQVELVSPEERDVRNREFIREWEKRIGTAPGIENFTIEERQTGPPGRDLTVRLTGDDPRELKEAALELAETLDDFAGTFATQDDTPFGREQLVFDVEPEGRALGLDTEAVANQLRNAYEGHLAQLYQDGLEEVEVRVRLPDRERHATESLENLRLRLPSGELAPLDSVVDLRSRQGFETLRHADTRLAIEVSTEVDRAENNAARIRGALEDGPLDELAERHGVDYSFEGRAADQAETFADMRIGLILALALMYITLAWVFASWGWPLIVMAIIPFGILGALLGHWLMNVELTILSLFGLFGLTGIVVNNSIILVSFYQGLRGAGLALGEAIVEAACQRLRAVILTSVTTIAGLTPLLFEQSVQAQFLIPMAISIVFGLAVATVLVLFVIPALLRLYEGWFDHGAVAAANGSD